MGRVMAIDYGTKRTGLAVTDETRTFAFGLTTVSTHELSNFLKKYLAENQIDGLVVGEPKTLANGPTHSSIHIDGFIKQLTKLFPDIPIYRMDERFTSKMASKAILDSGVNKKGRSDKALVDMVSATIILQSWLEKESGRKN